MLYNHDILTAGETRSLAKLKDTDPEARQKLISHNLRLAAWAAEKHRGEMDFDDLMQEATVALIKAIDTYDPSRNAKLSTYAATVIDRHLVRTIYQDHLIKTPETSPRAKIISSDATLTEDTETVFIDCFTDTDETEDRKAMTAAVQYALSTLPERERYVMAEYYLNGRKAKDIGADLGVSDSMVHNYRIAALQALRHPDVIDKIRDITEGCHA